MFDRHAQQLVEWGMRRSVSAPKGAENEMQSKKIMRSGTVEFLHYNNCKTPGAKDNMFDKRPHLGLPSWFKK